MKKNETRAYASVVSGYTYFLGTHTLNASFIHMYVFIWHDKFERLLRVV